MSEVSWGNAKVVSPDQKLIATARGGAVVLNSVTTGELLYALKGLPPARSLEFSPDSRLLAAGHWDGTAELFNFSTGKAILRMSGFKDAVSSFGFSRDGRFIAAGSWDGSIRIWDIASQAECMKLLGHRAGVGRVIFSNDGRTLISGGATGDLTVRFWSMATGREVFDLHTPRSAFYLALSANDQILATGGDDGMVQLWRAPALAEIDRATR
jgi:WD40 repeat protein